jgi:hypothetical protein
MAHRGIALNASTLNTLIYELVREGDIQASLLLVREVGGNRSIKKKKKKKKIFSLL